MHETIMPATGEELKVGDITLLEPNVHGGIRLCRLPARGRGKRAAHGGESKPGSRTEEIERIEAIG